MEYARRQFSGRDLAKNPMTFDEQKRISVAYAESHDVIELPANAEHVTLDILEFGGEDEETSGPQRRREYVPTPDGMSIGAVKGMGK